MDVTKKYSITNILVLLFLILFPFGQLLKQSFQFDSFVITLQPMDVVAGLAFVYVLLKRKKIPVSTKYILDFLIVLAISLLYSLTIFSLREVFIGFFYLVRLISYFAFFLLVYDFATSAKERKLLFNSLIVVCFFIAMFGWIQYFLYPDLRTFTVWGWDDHLYRLVSTFIDPGFTSIILAFGFLASIGTYLQKKKVKYAILSFFFLLTLAFTYSRAGYLAMFSGLTYLLFTKNKLKYLFGLFLIFALLILLLPRPSGTGVQLERLYSIVDRIENYRQTVTIWEKSPVFGVGYNNLCSARRRFIGYEDYASHSCSGSDSSTLLILATSGIVGFLVFLTALISLFRYIGGGLYGLVFKSSLVAILFHSQFVNSLFYPWVLGWMGMLLAVSLKVKGKNEGLK
jgi:hypothetical protein